MRLPGRDLLPLTSERLVGGQPEQGHSAQHLDAGPSLLPLAVLDPLRAEALGQRRGLGVERPIDPGLSDRGPEVELLGRAHGRILLVRAALEDLRREDHLVEERARRPGERDLGSADREVLPTVPDHERLDPVEVLAGLHRKHVRDPGDLPEAGDGEQLRLLERVMHPELAAGHVEETAEVEVRDVRLERRLHDREVELILDGVHDHVGPAEELRDRRLVPGINRYRGGLQPGGLRRRLGQLRIEVRNDHRVEHAPRREVPHRTLSR